MNKVTRIREGFISLNQQIDNLYAAFLRFSANLVGDKMVGDPAEDTNSGAGVFGAILNGQANLSRRIERVHRHLEAMQDQITLQLVEYDKPTSPELDTALDSAIEYMLETSDFTSETSKTGGSVA